MSMSDHYKGRSLPRLQFAPCDAPEYANLQMLNNSVENFTHSPALFEKYWLKFKFQ